LNAVLKNIVVVHGGTNLHDHEVAQRGACVDDAPSEDDRSYSYPHVRRHHCARMNDACQGPAIFTNQGGESSAQTLIADTDEEVVLTNEFAVIQQLIAAHNPDSSNELTHWGAGVNEAVDLALCRTPGVYDDARVAPLTCRST